MPLLSELGGEAGRVTPEASTVPLSKRVNEKKGYAIADATWTDERPHPPQLSQYESYYEKDGEYFAAVNVLSGMSVGVGFYTEGQKRAKEIVDAMAEEVGLDQIHLEVVQNMLIYGFCPVERYFMRGPPKGRLRLKVLPPKTIWKKVDKRGKLLGYVQKVGGQEVAKFKPRDIVFYKNGIGDYGKSIVAAIINLLEASEQFHEDMPKIIHRYGSPLVIIVHDVEVDVKKAFTDREPDEVVIISGIKPSEDFKVEVVGIDPRARFTDYVKEINESKMEALQAPLLRYLRNATEASATKMLEVIERRIEGIQRYIKRMDEREIYTPLLTLHGIIDEVPSIRWGVPQTGVEDINIDNFLTIGAEIGYITKKQYLDILRQKGLRIEKDDSEDPLIKRPDEPPEESFYFNRESVELKFKMVDKDIAGLEVGEYTHHRHSGRYRGTSVGRDDKGFFVMTHRARSKSYIDALGIPKSVIKFIKSTG